MVGLLHLPKPCGHFGVDHDLHPSHVHPSLKMHGMGMDPSIKRLVWSWPTEYVLLRVLSLSEQFLHAQIHDFALWDLYMVIRITYSYICLINLFLSSCFFDTLWAAKVLAEFALTFEKISHLSPSYIKGNSNIMFIVHVYSWLYFYEEIRPQWTKCSIQP